MTVSSGLPPLADGVTLCELGVDNLRALRMEAPVELRRLTLLAGRNGIGKSTFARVFPLLRQSARVRKREPLLWWEHGEVDFGGFETAVRRDSEEMTFTFGFADPDGTQWSASTALGRDPDGSRVRRLVIKDSHEWPSLISLAFDSDGHLQILDIQLPNSVHRLTEHEFQDNVRHFTELGVPRESFERLQADPGQLFAVLEDRKGTFQRKFFDHLPLADPLAAVAALKASIRLYKAKDLIDDLAMRTAYLGPFRAAPERTYRPQGVAVDQLDPRGANLAMFLAALSSTEREDLNAELREKLGFTVSIETSGGFYSLHVELNDGRYNLVDVGYGYSQVLPVAVQLWASRRTLSTRRDPAPDAIVVIEQPEIHLHPHQQVLLAQALGAFAADEHGPMQIIETHSDHLIGEIGMMIALGKLPPERVGVLCFEPHPEGGTRVFNAHFNEDGVLHDWPVGFLSP